MAYQALKRAYAKDEVRDMIEARLKAEHDEATRMESARLQGKLEDKLEGKLEGKLESAQRLIENGMEREEVARILGLSLTDLPE